MLSSDNEERLVKNNMREEIVRQILNRLRLLPTEAAPEPEDQTTQAVQ